jgi:hypothetical protein
MSVTTNSSNDGQPPARSRRPVRRFRRAVWGLLFAVGLGSLRIVGACTAAEAKIQSETIPDESAVGEFEFAAIPAPSRTDAGTSATIEVVSGRVDEHSGGPPCLNDGQLPLESDQPDRNFFFAPRTARGRVLFTLRDVTDVQAIHSYSWHPDVRAPQVYSVYGDGGDPQITAPDQKDADLVKHGWKLIADVTTRKEGLPPGGQTAVRIAGEKETLGRHRRLLFDVRQTDPVSPFAQTFFSEIDVLDGQEYPGAPEAKRKVSVLEIDGQYRIVFDTTEVADLKPWVDSTLKPACQTWYPKIVAMFPSQGFDAPRRLTITFHAEMDGVAHCSGTHIHCAAKWFRENLKGEAAGAVVHELVHVVQQFGRTRGSRRNPGWLVEGLADYVRWFLYEPESQRPRPDPQTARYTDSYRTTGAFLAWLVEKHGQGVVTSLNATLREGTYTPAVWERVAGATVDDLWAEYVKTLKP